MDDKRHDLLERMNSMKKTQEFLEMKEVILKNESLSNKMKSVELSLLLSNMVSYFDIPLTYGEDYRRKNENIVLVFEDIAEEIGRLNEVG